MLYEKKTCKINGESFGNFKNKLYLCIAFETKVYGRLAQLVQSIWFTSRGSAVRIRQRPHKKNKHFVLSNGRLAQLV